MAPVLSLYSVPVQTARHNSQACSMNPYRLQVSGYNNQASFSVNSVKYLNMTSLLIDMQDEENGSKGEYYSLDTKIWKLLDIKKKTDSRGRIHVNEINYEKDIRVFVSNVDQVPETCKHYSLLPHSIFTEIRKTRVKEQAGEPMKVQSSGDVWLGAGNKNKFVKVFVKVE